MEFLKKKQGLFILGAIGGLLAVLLGIMGNPANMALCIACFIRDMAGGMKLHTTATVQYVRPEIIGIVVGAFGVSLATKEFRSQAGSSTAIRFVLGATMMTGALIFLGCPLRMVLRMAAGDLNAYVALIGFVLGVSTGAFFLKKGFSLGRAYDTNKAAGMALPIGLIILFICTVTTTTLFAVSTEGPASMRAPVIISLVCGLIFGVIAQRSRMCFAGSVRDVVLMKDFTLLCVIAGVFVVVLIGNLVNGSFKLGFEGQPIAHTEHIWNIIGMYIVGFSAVMAGGCPLRQLILAGQGSSDAAMTAIGMLVGAAFVHNFKIASSADGTTPMGRIAAIACVVVLFVIAFTCTKRKK